MIAASVFTECLLALTPVQRWQAARSFITDVMTERWFINVGCTFLIVLSVLFIIESLYGTWRRRKLTKGLFFEYANKRGLSSRERQILLDIAVNARLRHSEAIFTMSDTFDAGAAKMTKQSYARTNPDKSASLKVEISFLREKLGFQKRSFTSIGSPARAKKMSSRNIPVGKKLHLTNQKSCELSAAEATIIKNNDTELAVQLPVEMENSHGDIWRVRYCFGASIWEFDTFATGCDGEILVLEHRDDVRFINRRRFLRVPVVKTAFIAHFPFTRALGENDDNAVVRPEKQKDLAETSFFIGAVPEFFPAVVTELAGPGLCVETSLELNWGDRVLVIFGLDGESRQDSNPSGRIIEDIGEVRNVKAVENGFSVAVELTGLSDSDVDGLIRVANAALVRAEAGDENAPALTNAGQYVDRPAAVQGV